MFTLLLVGCAGAVDAAGDGGTPEATGTADEALLLPDIAVVACHTLDEALALGQAAGGSFGTLVRADANYREYQAGAVWRKTDSGCAFEVHGAIFGKWRALGGPNSVVGGPLTDESATTGKFGRYNHFEKGSIYWSPSTGANAIYGSIRATWFSMDRQNGVLGFPKTDESWAGNGRYNDFENGALFWSGATGTIYVPLALRDKWRSSVTAGGSLAPSFAQITSLVTLSDKTTQFMKVTNGAIVARPGRPAFALWDAFADPNGIAKGYPIDDSQDCGEGIYLSNFDDRAQVLDTRFGSRTMSVVAGKRLTCKDARANRGDTLWPNQRLEDGQYLTNGDQQLKMNGCRLELRDHRGLVWQRGTDGTGCVAVMQTDGNFVLYRPDGTAPWASDTHAGNRVVVQSDGNAVLYDDNDGSSHWATNTVEHPITETMTDRCSGDVFLAREYTDAAYTPGVSSGLYLARNASGETGWSPTMRVNGHVFIRWYCHSTTGNWLDPGTWRINSLEVGTNCVGDWDNGELGTCKATGSASFSSSAADGWTAERSRCASSGTHNVQARLGRDRLLQIRCMD
jgi:hypothetical protein